MYENTGFYPAAISPDGKWLALDKPTTAADSDVYVADLTKARELLGYDPQVSLDEGITRSVAWRARNCGLMR